jgi:DNA-binding MarR family transcriptional regulator
MCIGRAREPRPEDRHRPRLPALFLVVGPLLRGEGHVPSDDVARRLPKTDEEDELLKPAIADLLRTIPETWAEYDPERLTHVQTNALILLTAAGMVERRGWLRFIIANHPTCLEVRLQATGERGFAKALKKAIAFEYATWGDVLRAWRDSEAGHVSPIHTEALKPQEWRLTDQGVIARSHLDDPSPDVFDFVLKRGFFGPGYWCRVAVSNPQRVEENYRLIAKEVKSHRTDWTQLPRPPVIGDGCVLAIRKVEQSGGVHSVNVANWAEGGEVFATAFEKILRPLLEAMEKAAQRPAQAEHGATKWATRKAKPQKHAQSRGKELVISALLEHHQYDNGSVGNWNTIGVSKLAAKIGVGKSTVSRVMKKLFRGGYEAYKQACYNGTLPDLLTRLADPDVFIQKLAERLNSQGRMKLWGQRHDPDLDME